MNKHELHIQNVFDVLNPLGGGVNGYLKLKCIQIQNRVAGSAVSGDIIVVSDDCPQAFIDYMFNVLNVKDVLVLRYRLSRDPQRYLNSHVVFEALVNNPGWEETLRRDPDLNLYVQSRSAFAAAYRAGIRIPEERWKTVVVDRVVDAMNDKANLYRECEALGLPLPRHWIMTSDQIVSDVVDLLLAGERPLFIRQARSAGGFGNITVEKHNAKYRIRELESRLLDLREFVHVLDRFVRTSFWDEYVVAELLDLYASPGTLFFANDTETLIISHSNQILSAGRSFHGFTYPIADPKIERHFTGVETAVLRIVEPWREKGFRGYGNIDWMVTVSGECFIAEMNGRTTAVVPPIKIENCLSRHGCDQPPVKKPRLSIFSQDKVNLNGFHTFDNAYEALHAKGLLWGQHGDGSGIVIILPPSPEFGINTIGILALGENLEIAAGVFKEGLHVFGEEQEELLLGG
ncbi:MAG TPA: hypothetical protein VGK02_04395 [Candidatus Aquicultor sp.]